MGGGELRPGDRRPF